MPRVLSCLLTRGILQVQKKLSDEDKQLVQNNMLVGIAPELIGNTPEEMRAISTGKGDQFVVQGVLRYRENGGCFFVRLAWLFFGLPVRSSSAVKMHIG